MPRNVKDIIKKLPPARRKKIEARARQLIAEEMTRQQLRVALKQTQVEVAKTLGTTQACRRSAFDLARLCQSAGGRIVDRR